MAVTITRTPWIDDDGSGQTGTVINNAVKTSIYNEIDGALAKVAQLTGGNAFTGNQSIAGLLTVTGAGTHSFTASLASGVQTLVVQNTSAGNAGAAMWIGNNVSPNLGQLLALSSTYVQAGANLPNGISLVGAGSGGLSLWAADAVGAIRFYSGSGATERMRIIPAGDILIGATAAIGGAAALAIAADAAVVRPPLIIQNLSGTNSGNLVSFVNSVVGIAGSIAQTGATTVAYITTSDARLKDDGGPATDLAALRAIVVHDFTWKADGLRDRGIFAQDAHALYPRAIVAGTDETTESGDLARPWGTDYSKFVSDLIVGWQQHDAELAELRAALATLKGSPHA